MLGIMRVFGDDIFGNVVVVGVSHMFFESIFEGSTSFPYVRHSARERYFIDSGA